MHVLEMKHHIPSHTLKRFEPVPWPQRAFWWYQFETFSRVARTGPQGWPQTAIFERMDTSTGLLCQGWPGPLQCWPESLFESLVMSTDLLCQGCQCRPTGLTGNMFLKVLAAVGANTRTDFFCGGWAFTGLPTDQGILQTCCRTAPEIRGRRIPASALTISADSSEHPRKP